MKIRILINVRIKECANLECANGRSFFGVMCQWLQVTGLRFAFVADYRCALVAGILSPESEGETGLSAALLFLRLRRPSACPPHGGESRAALLKTSYYNVIISVSF